MGTIQSYLSTETLVALLLVSGAVGYGLAQRQLATPGASAPAPEAATAASAPSAASKKGGKKKKQAAAAPAAASAPAAAEAAPIVVAFPDVVPGGFDAPAVATPALDAAEQGAPAAKKGKKKKAKKAAAAGGTDEQSDAPSSVAAGPSQPAALAPPATTTSGRKAKKAPAAAPPPPADDDEAWTRVETRKRAAKGEKPASSDAGVTTEATGASSPATAGTDAGTESGADEGAAAAARPEETRRPLAERLLPKPRKTGVDDMLETPDYPEIARVMRVQPAAGESPAAGFSWGDYEDVKAGTEADGEDDGGGWGVVRGKRTTSTNRSAGTTTASKAPTDTASDAAKSKKQRQNAAKSDALKAAKAEAEAERLARLAAHKRELERTRIAEHYAGGAKAKGKVPTGTASVSDTGKLVWD